MKKLVAFVFAVVALVIAYRYHVDEVNRAAEEAKEAALLSMVTPVPAKPIVHAVSISRQLEPLYLGVFANLDTAQPADLVPPLQLTRERILDHRAKVEPGMQSIYDAGAAAVSVLIATAQERTVALGGILQGEAASRASLDSKTTSSNSGAFFVQSTLKRWEMEKQRQKVIADQLMTRLRNAERNWNAGAAPGAPEESYDLPAVSPVMVNPERSLIRSTSLEQSESSRGLSNPSRQRSPQQGGQMTR